MAEVEEKSEMAEEREGTGAAGSVGSIPRLGWSFPAVSEAVWAEAALCRPPVEPQRSVRMETLAVKAG